MNDARMQQNLLEKSKLNWTVIRTPVHKNNGSIKIKNIGYSQPPIWKKIPKIAIAEFIFEYIKNNKWSKESPIIY